MNNRCTLIALLTIAAGTLFLTFCDAFPPRNAPEVAIPWTPHPKVAP